MAFGLRAVLLDITYVCCKVRTITCSQFPITPILFQEIAVEYTFSDKMFVFMMLIIIVEVIAIAVLARMTNSLLKSEGSPAPGDEMPENVNHLILGAVHLPDGSYLVTTSCPPMDGDIRCYRLHTGTPPANNSVVRRRDSRLILQYMQYGALNG